MQQDTFTQNLGYLCTFYPSIAEVCRRLDLNRQQFNKYLSGQVRPSRHNMLRICDFFGVTESELLLDSGRFVEIISLKRTPAFANSLTEPLSHIEALFGESRSLDRYVGYYFRYYYAFSYQGFLIKSLARILEKDGRYYWSNIEVVQNETSSRPTTTGKYKGAAFFLSDRIFVVEYHSLLRNSITQMILYPSYHTRISYLIGIQTGAPVLRGRKPGASLVLLEYLGKNIDVRKALRSTGLFHEDSGTVDPTIRERVRNRIPDGSYVLEATEV